MLLGEQTQFAWAGAGYGRFLLGFPAPLTGMSHDSSSEVGDEVRGYRHNEKEAGDNRGV
jgi:hypothetical protein